MTQIKLAVVGAGRQCTHALMPALPFIEEIDLVAVCDLDATLAQRNARNFGALASYTDVADMLQHESPDAVMVVGPPQIHEDIGLQVLEAGCHLFIEKPIAPTVAGARRLVEAARRVGKVGQVGHMMRHAGPVAIAREIAGRPEFGEILSVESKYTTWPTGQVPAGSGWGEPDEDWSYMLIQGCHPIDLMQSFLGPIHKVAAFRKHGSGNAKVYQVSVEAEGGRTGFLNLQDSYNGWYTGLEIVGDGQAIVRVDDLGRVTYRNGERNTEPEQLNWGNAGYTWEPHHTLPSWARGGYGHQLQAFARSILHNNPTSPSLEDGWRALVVAQAILESCASGQTVIVPQ